MYASTAVVVPRSYSRQIGATSCESETGRSGKRSRSRSRVARSCSGFRYENSRHTATATGPSAVRAEALGDAIAEPGEVDRLEHAALLVDPLGDRNAVGTVHQRLGLAPVEVVVVLAVDPLDVRHVLESPGREVEDARALAREHGVDADRRADHDEADVRGVEPRRLDRRGDRGHRVGRVRRHLRDVPAAGRIIDRDEVGERSTGVDSHSDSHSATLPTLRACPRRTQNARTRVAGAARAR